MKSFAKNILSLGIITALSLGTIAYSHAATYEVVDKGSAGNLEYTYGRGQNNQGVMALLGAKTYNFPVQFDYLSDTDFNNIVLLALRSHDYYYGLEPIEDYDSLVAGDPTANDLAWTRIYLQNQNKIANFVYQVIGDQVIMTNLGEGSKSEEIRVFDSAFDGSNNSESIITRSTQDYIEGITNTGALFGSGTAPYLAMEPFTGSNGVESQHWLREHGTRGFYSPDNGVTIIEVPPLEVRYGGGISALRDMNDIGMAVGYSSYKLSAGREEGILDPTNGCKEPNRYNIPYEICIQNNQSNMYHIQAFEMTISSMGELETKPLGLLVNPHKDDIRPYTSQALAVNNSGVAVGFSHGWDAGEVEAPVVDERMTASYAVMFKDGKVFDFNQPHYFFNTRTPIPFSSANDINDDGLVVGNILQLNPTVKKFFYVDTSVPESEIKIITPVDFFKSSVSTAFAVNNHGVIVGEGQIESHNESAQNPRRTVGFLYDTASANPVIVDVNTLTECNSIYNILKANDINDSGQISATAVVKGYRYDAKGEVVLDESGNPTEVDVVRAVLLNPISGGEVEDCGDVEEKVERRGASFGGLSILALFTLFGIRRKQLRK